jgi:hypothetical protein
MGSAAIQARRFASLVVALLALNALVAAAAQAFKEPSGDLVALGEETVLRLHDLPPGYQIGDDSGCGPWIPEGEPDGVIRFIVENWPEGCDFEYERLFELPGTDSAPLVYSGSSVFPTLASADRGFELLSGIEERSQDTKLREVVPAPQIGDRARLFRSEDVLVEGRSNRSGSFLVWRQGRIVSQLLIAGRAPAANSRIALRLAALQQARVEAPSPYTEAERNDAAVALDDPSLGYPVYWLGSTFAPGHGLPATALEDAFTVSGPGEAPPGEKAMLWYDEFHVDLWTRTSWTTFERSALGPLNRRWRCTNSNRVALADGHADVFAAYGKDFRRCPKRPPDRFYAIAHLGHMVVGVNLIFCTHCLGPGSGPYNSRAGMEAIVRGLVVRPKPVY